jgi:hypothetical protein
MPTIPAPKQERHLGLQYDCHEETDCRNDPLQPVLHAKLCQPVTRMQDEGDDGWADPIKNCGDCWQVAEVHVERTQRRHNHEIWKDKCPPAGPRPPETGAQVRDVNAHLDRKWSGQRLTDCDCFAHLIFTQPPPVGDQLTLHLAYQRDRATKSQQTEAQKIRHNLAESGTCGRCGYCHISNS